MTLVYIWQVKSNQTKSIAFISDDDFDCSWYHSVNAGEQHRKLLDLIHLNADRKDYCYSKHERAGIS